MIGLPPTGELVRTAKAAGPLVTFIHGPLLQRYAFWFHDPTGHVVFVYVLGEKPEDPEEFGSAMMQLLNIRGETDGG